MNIVTDLRAFVEAHQRCGGSLVGDADVPTERGYRLWLTCGCGALLERWVTPEDAERDLVLSDLLAFRN